MRNKIEYLIWNNAGKIAVAAFSVAGICYIVLAIMLANIV